MKKLVFKFFLLSLFACISFFTIDKVYAVNIDTYDNEPQESYVYLNNKAYLTKATQETFKGLNYWYVGDPNPVQEMRFVYDIVPSYKTYDVTFQVFGPDTRGVTPYIGNNSCQTFASGVTVNSSSVDYDSNLSNYYNVYCYNIPGGTRLDILFRIDWAISSSLHRVGVGRFYFTDSLTNIGNLNEAQKETNDKLDNLNEAQKETNDYIKDDTDPDVDISSLGTVQGLLPEGPVDSLLNIPFLFLSVLTSSFGGVCTPLEGTFVFGSTLSIPCFSEMFYDNVPSGLMIFINLIPASFILIKYFKHLYKKVDRAVSMDSNSDDEWGVL